MFTLVIGGSASGKSAFAESVLQRQSGRRIYLATMQPLDGESVQRIERHRAMRAGKGFEETIERFTDLAGAEIPPDSSILLEDLSNLTANELYSPQGRGTDSVILGVESVLKKCRDLTIVTNEVFSGGTDYEGDTLHFLRELAGLNRALAAKAGLVVEVVCAVPNVLKGSL